MDRDQPARRDTLREANQIWRIGVARRVLDLQVDPVPPSPIPQPLILSEISRPEGVQPPQGNQRYRADLRVAKDVQTS